MPHHPARQTGLVVPDQMNDVIARDVLRGDARDARPVECIVEPHASDPAVGNRRADGAAPELAGEVNVVEVESSPGDFVDAIEARRRTSDDPHRFEPTLGHPPKLCHRTMLLYALETTLQEQFLPYRKY